MMHSARILQIGQLSILVPRARRVLVTWWGNEGLWKQPLPDVRKSLTSGRECAEVTISLLMLITDFCPSPLHWGKNFTSWALSREWLRWDVFKTHQFTQLGLTDNLELKEENINRNQLNTLLVCRTETINRADYRLSYVSFFFFPIRLANKH